MKSSAASSSQSRALPLRACQQHSIPPIACVACGHLLLLSSCLPAGRRHGLVFKTRPVRHSARSRSQGSQSVRNMRSAVQQCFMPASLALATMTNGSPTVLLCVNSSLAHRHMQNEARRSKDQKCPGQTNSRFSAGPVSDSLAIATCSNGLETRGLDLAIHYTHPAHMVGRSLLYKSTPCGLILRISDLAKIGDHAL